MVERHTRFERAVAVAAPAAERGRTVSLAQEVVVVGPADAGEQLYAFSWRPRRQL
ncbi:MAG: hypothetical protein RR983_07995 [Massilia sp.]